MKWSNINRGELRRIDVKYCSLLDEMDKQMCEEEYNRMMEEIKANFES